MTDLLLIPGHLCDARLWTPQIETLSALAKVSVAETQCDDSMQGIASRILASAPPRFALAGLSMGGHVCMEIMRQAPERIEKLALLDTGAASDNEARRDQRKQMLSRFQAGEIDQLVDEFMDLLLWTERSGDSALVGDIKKMMIEVAPTAFEAQVNALWNRPDSRADMTSYACPTLILCGAEDRLTPPNWSIEMADLIPGAAIVLIADCGHMSTLERPEAVNAALMHWLTSQEH